MFKKKIIPFIFIFVILSSFLCLHVSAESSFSVRTHAITFSNSDYALGSTRYSNFGTNGYEFKARLNDGGYYPANDYFWRISFQVGGLANSFISFKMSVLDEGVSSAFLNNVKCYVSSTADSWIECSPNVTFSETYLGCVSFKIPQNIDIYYILIYVPIKIQSSTYEPSLVLYDFNTSSYDPLPDYSAIIDNQNSNTDKEIQADKENTQSQIQADKDLYDKEHNEITDSGSSATDSVDAVPDKSEGFISSLGGLISALSYNGTECAWTFPAIKLPAISGVMGEMVLSEEQPIDFSFWVEKMPSNILTLIRAITTIALVVYCFKELYSTISYVLTLKGGGE